MPSFSRNIRSAKSIPAVALACALASGAALADGAHRFVFTAYRDAAGGSEVVSGRYGAALQVLQDRAPTLAVDTAAADTNRCVAYSMSLQLQKARSACDAAVLAARERRNQSPAWWSWSGDADGDGELVAIAYANRAVMDWMVHDEAAARKDLVMAQQLSPRADFVARNLAALDGHRLLAQSRSPAPRS